jgi:hypothetical protein
MSLFHCLGYAEVSGQFPGTCSCFVTKPIFTMRSCQHLPNPQAGGLHIFGCPLLLIQYIYNDPQYWRTFLRPQSEDAPCRGDRFGPPRNYIYQLDLDSAFLCRLLCAQDQTSVFWSGNIKVFYVDVYIQVEHNFYVEFKSDNIFQKVHYYVTLNVLNCVCSTSTSLVAIDRAMCKSSWLLDRRDVIEKIGNMC